MNSIKKTGFILALISVIIKAVLTIIHLGDIIDWWGGMIPLFLVLAFTHGLAIWASSTKDNVSIGLSIALIAVSAIFLVGDGIMFLGFAASLNSTPLTEIGITPICNVINIISGIAVLIESVRKRNNVRYYHPYEVYTDTMYPEQDIRTTFEEK